jgi:hypothetical protein
MNDWKSGSDQREMNKDIQRKMEYSGFEELKN